MLQWMSAHTQKMQFHISTRLWDIVVSRILLFDWSGEFWTITQEPVFSQASRFSKKLQDHSYFHVQVKKIHMNGLQFCQKPHNIFWGIFGTFWAHLTRRDFFFKNLALSLFLLYGYLSLSKNQKFWDLELKKEDRRDEWKNSVKFTGHFQ